MVDGSPVEPAGVSPAELDILRTIRSLRFGAVEIQVHDGRVVQIERRERVRIDDRPRGR
ncbi:MAG: putative small protein [Planctomycetota bacterium]|jgi:hypothetical protein